MVRYMPISNDSNEVSAAAAALGRKGGLSKSPAKLAAIARNSVLGAQAVKAKWQRIRERKERAKARYLRKKALNFSAKTITE